MYFFYAQEVTVVIQCRLMIKSCIEVISQIRWLLSLGEYLWHNQLLLDIQEVFHENLIVIATFHFTSSFLHANTQTHEHQQLIYTSVCTKHSIKHPRWVLSEKTPRDGPGLTSTPPENIKQHLQHPSEATAPNCWAPGAAPTAGLCFRHPEQ